MVALEAVRTANRALKHTLSGRYTVLFVGGTSGIGRSTLRQLARHTETPNLYIIGRSSKNAAPLLSELEITNPKGTFNFIEADVSLIRNVDEACAEIQRREDKLNLLFMTPGGISLGGRNETSEGIDHLFALRYYSRMRFIQNLLPLLENTSPSRVISILGGGFEGPISKDDLDLKHNYSILRCALHAVTMTSLSMEHLAAKTSSPDLSFVHAFPGIVGTNIYANSFPPAVAAIYNYGMWPLMWPFSVNLDESGERHLFQSTSPRYAGKDQSANTAYGAVGPPKDVDVALGPDGQSGSGAYLVNWKGKTRVAGKRMQQYRKEGMPAHDWAHTVELLERAARR